VNLVEALERLGRQHSDALNAVPPIPQGDTILSPVQEAARQDVLTQLAANPNVKRAFETRFEDNMLIVTLGVRGIGTCELKIPGERFDPDSLDDYAALVACFDCEGSA
jgi:hypothetical protein